MLVLSDVLRRLRGEGLPATVHKVRNAIVTGRVKPRPEQDGAGNYQFTLDHLEQLREYVARPPKAGRPRLHAQESPR